MRLMHNIHFVRQHPPKYDYGCFVRAPNALACFIISTGVSSLKIHIISQHIPHSVKYLLIIKTFKTFKLYPLDAFE